MKTKEYDIASYLSSEEEMQMYLNEIMEDGELSLILSALGDIARARNMSQLSREVGMSREGLYHALSGRGNPTFSAMMKITKALGLKLHFTGA
ncbi:addiction module antidote protein [Candidatus Erwinia dacicola]|uniref:Helix-turn-helix family protein n=1 Tax=Candidatus Erwinia dacicola TaxID=252393 RepID=A0A328THW7_9GAMM|nr:addiction module antidote protein [Candidatus Erwinia dacicola]NJD85259.1 putative addiction module antidote protein [Candidatus Erwinia dacicola]RAP69600.1 helix-turn-helix family protein [Candidatus Erwinia dacicola]